MNSPYSTFSSDRTPPRPAGLRPQPGLGRITVNTIGFALGDEPAGPLFNHPFRATLSGTSLKVQRGLVELVEPTIGHGKVRMSTTVLPLEAAKRNADGESWAGVEVEPLPDGTLPKGQRRELVHRTDPLFYTPEVGFFPVALILWRGSAPFRVLQVAFFNCRYFRLKENGVVRHLFP
jgi:hypothetical protein